MLEVSKYMRKGFSISFLITASSILSKKSCSKVTVTDMQLQLHVSTAWPCYYSVY